MQENLQPSKKLVCILYTVHVYYFWKKLLSTLYSLCQNPLGSYLVCWQDVPLSDMWTQVKYDWTPLIVSDTRTHSLGGCGLAGGWGRLRWWGGGWSMGRRWLEQASFFQLIATTCLSSTSSRSGAPDRSVMRHWNTSSPPLPPHPR